MVMFGMLLGLGMLIDGAIVVVELADRKMAGGAPPKAAYLAAARRMFWPICASVGTTLAAFLPLMFWPGVTGQFMRYLPVTVFAVLAGSLLYALVFAPVLGGLLSPSRNQKGDPLADVGRDFEYSSLSGITGLFGRVLASATRHPVWVLGITLGLLFAIVRWYGVAGNGAQFFVDVEPSFTGVSVGAKGNYSASEMRDLVTDVEQRVVAQGDIKSIYTRAGSGTTGGAGSGQTGDEIGFMFVELTDRFSRSRDGWAVVQSFRDAITGLPGVRAEIKEQERGPPVGKDLQIQLQGQDLTQLAIETKRVRAFLESMTGVIAVDDTAPVPGIDWEIKVDREKAAMMGADVTSVGSAIQLMTNGVLIGRYRPDTVDDEVDIRSALSPSQPRVLQAG